MSQSQVVSFRASGHFLNWIEAQKLDSESLSQAAQRILKEVSGTSTALSNLSTPIVSTVSTNLSTQSNDSVVSTEIVDTVDKAVADRLDPVMERMGVPATVRASFAAYNSPDEIDALATGIRTAVELFAGSGR